MYYDRPFYTKEADGTIAKWYVYGWYGSRFSVTPRKNGKLRDHHKYYDMADIGKTIFASRREAERSAL